jgi:hypothetical protein
MEWAAGAGERLLFVVSVTYEQQLDQVCYPCSSSPPSPPPCSCVMEYSSLLLLMEYGDLSSAAL